MKSRKGSFGLPKGSIGQNDPAGISGIPCGVQRPQAFRMLFLEGFALGSDEAIDSYTSGIGEAQFDEKLVPACDGCLEP